MEEYKNIAVRFARGKRSSIPLRKNIIDAKMQV